MEEEYKVAILPSATPVFEFEINSVPLPENIANQELENICLQDIPGRNNEIDDIIYRNLPECQLKSSLICSWFTIYGKWRARKNLISSVGTGGTEFQSGSFLSHDIALWKKDRKFSRNAKHHLCNYDPAPNWILKFEWCNENKPRKRVDKRRNHFFAHTNIGTNGTVVQEMWILVKSRRFDLPNKPQLPILLHILRLMAKYLPLFWIVLLLLDVLIPLWNWSGVIKRRNHPPPYYQGIPYLVIYFRNQSQAYGYYWLEWNTTFVAPKLSLYSTAPSMNVNSFLHDVMEFER